MFGGGGDVLGCADGGRAGDLVGEGVVRNCSFWRGEGFGGALGDLVCFKWEAVLVNGRRDTPLSMLQSKLRLSRGVMALHRNAGGSRRNSCNVVAMFIITSLSLSSPRIRRCLLYDEAPPY